MGFSDRCCYWVIIQVVAIILCYWGNASGSTNTAQGCVGSRLDLRCPSTKVIREINIRLGVSGCKGIRCCIEDADCFRSPSEGHMKLVHDTCEGQQNCTVEINSFEASPCVFGSWWRGNKRTIDGHAFERITYSCSESEPRWNEKEEKEESEKEVKEDLENVDKLISTDGTTTKLYSNTEADGKNEETSKADGSRSYSLTVVMAIICLVILLAIVVLVVVIINRRTKRAKVRLSHPVALTQVDNCPNESDIYANETQETSQRDNNEDPAVYSQVEKRKLGWKEGQNDSVTTDKTKAAVDSHTAGSDVYAVVNKPSKTPATSSALKTDQLGVKGIVNMGDCFPDQIYSLASNDMEDIYANETAVDSSTRLMAEAVAKTPSPDDDGDMTLIENDLYCH